MGDNGRAVGSRSQSAMREGPVEGIQERSPGRSPSPMSQLGIQSELREGPAERIRERTPGRSPSSMRQVMIQHESEEREREPEPVGGQAERANGIKVEVVSDHHSRSTQIDLPSKVLISVMTGAQTILAVSSFAFFLASICVACKKDLLTMLAPVFWRCVSRFWRPVSEGEPFCYSEFTEILFPFEKKLESPYLSAKLQETGRADSEVMFETGIFVSIENPIFLGLFLLFCVVLLLVFTYIKKKAIQSALESATIVTIHVKTIRTTRQRQLKPDRPQPDRPQPDRQPGRPQPDLRLQPGLRLLPN